MKILLVVVAFFAADTSLAIWSDVDQEMVADLKESCESRGREFRFVGPAEIAKAKRKITESGEVRWEPWAKGKAKSVHKNVVTVDCKEYSAEDILREQCVRNGGIPDPKNKLNTSCACIVDTAKNGGKSVFAKLSGDVTMGCFFDPLCSRANGLPTKQGCECVLDTSDSQNELVEPLKFSYQSVMEKELKCSLDTKCIDARGLPSHYGCYCPMTNELISTSALKTGKSCAINLKLDAAGCATKGATQEILEKIEDLSSCLTVKSACVEAKTPLYPGTVDFFAAHFKDYKDWPDLLKQGFLADKELFKKFTTRASYLKESSRYQKSGHPDGTANYFNQIKPTKLKCNDPQKLLYPVEPDQHLKIYHHFSAVAYDVEKLKKERIAAAKAEGKILSSQDEYLMGKKAEESLCGTYRQFDMYRCEDRWMFMSDLYSDACGNIYRGFSLKEFASKDDGFETLFVTGKGRKLDPFVTDEDKDPISEGSQLDFEVGKTFATTQRGTRPVGVEELFMLSEPLLTKDGKSEAEIAIQGRVNAMVSPNYKFHCGVFDDAMERTPTTQDLMHLIDEQAAKLAK